MTKMYVIKRDSKKQEVSFDKIYSRINWLAENPTVLQHVNTAELTQLVIQGIVDNIKTSEIDEYTASLSANLVMKHYEYLVLAGRIIINNHHKNTLNSFSDKVNKLYLDANSSTISKRFHKFVNIHKHEIDKQMIYDRDYFYDFFGFKTMEKGYLLHVKMPDNESSTGFKEITVERPQDMIMRVAIQIHMPKKSEEFRTANLDKIFHAYDMMSQGYYTHATPTLFNSASAKPNLSSCFLLSSEDSLEGIMKSLTDCCKISKWSGGIGIHINNWRAQDSVIRGTNGKSNGIVPFLRMFNAGARAFDQGSKRNGSFAIYLEMHHPDIMNFVALRLNNQGTDPNMRCPDLFLALWVSDLFMKRLQYGELWSVFCPDECPGLNNVFGEKYEELYLKYESEGKAKARYNPMDIMKAIKHSHDESGLPYILYKDTINKSSMMNNIGTVKSSNLCVSADTIILTDKGYARIDTLTNCYNPPVHNVWNGHEFSAATFAKTGILKQLLEIRTDNCTIRCTPEHEVIVLRNNVYIRKEAQTLNIFDTMIRIKTDNSLNSNNIVDKHHYIEHIISITRLLTTEDTYCFNEPIRHQGVFNGLLLGQCSEITIYSDKNETGTCNLSSICLPKFVMDTYSEEEQVLPEEARRVLNHEYPVNPKMNWRKLAEIAGDITENLNNVIDTTYTPVIEAARSNFKHRPIGIGVQGLADVFMKFGIAYDSEQARDINKKISEAIYYGSLSKSSEICRRIYNNIVKSFDNGATEYNHTIFGDYVLQLYPDLYKENLVAIYKNKKEVPRTVGAYSSYAANGGSHLYNGKFHWELYGLEAKDLSGLFDWESLREHIKIFGVRNCLTTAYMPTGTTSSIMGYTPAFEPYVTNVFKRKTLAGTYAVVNKYLIKYLQDSGIYDAKFNKFLLANNGDIQNIDGIPDRIKALFKTTWDMKQRSLMQLAIDRQPFIDQSQSMNLYFKDYTLDKFCSAQMYAWENGLKCGVYYTKTREAVEPSKFTISKKDIDDLSLLETIKNKVHINDKDVEEEICLSCSA